MIFLQPHNSNLGDQKGPCVEFSLEREELVLKVEYRFSGELHTSEHHTHEFENWGLWEHDVFEVFVTKEEELVPYLEVQVSPLNQKFALLIQRPREKWVYPKSVPFSSETSVESGVWKSIIRIPLKNIPGNGSLKGNVFAILGEGRDYYALNPNQEELPDHHRPELFVDFLADKKEGK